MTDPSQHQGPFIDPPRRGLGGFFRRADSSVTQTQLADPTRPPEPPRPASRPTRRAPAGGPLAAGAAWAWRTLGWRMIVILVVLAYALRGALEGIMPGDPAPTDPPGAFDARPVPSPPNGAGAPGSTVPRGAEVVQVLSLADGWVVVRDRRGRGHRWKVSDAVLAGRLESLLRRDAIVAWERDDAGRVVVNGVIPVQQDGAAGSLPAT